MDLDLIKEGRQWKVCDPQISNISAKINALIAGEEAAELVQQISTAVPMQSQQNTVKPTLSIAQAVSATRVAEKEQSEFATRQAIIALTPTSTPTPTPLSEADYELAIQATMEALESWKTITIDDGLFDAQPKLASYSKWQIGGIDTRSDGSVLFALKKCSPSCGPNVVSELLPDGSWRHFGKSEGFSLGDIEALNVRDDGQIFYILRNIVSVSPDFEVVESYSCDDPGAGGLRTIHDAPDGSIWFNCGRHVTKIDTDNTVSRIYQTSRWFDSMSIGRDGLAWFIESGSLFWADLEGHVQEKYSIATIGELPVSEGVAEVPPCCKDVYIVAAVDRSAWIFGLSIYPPKTRRIAVNISAEGVVQHWIYVDFFRGDFIKGAAVDIDNAAWFVSTESVMKITNSGEAQIYKDEIDRSFLKLSTIHADDFGRVWIGGKTGVIVVE